MLISLEEHHRLSKVKVPVWIEITRPDGNSLTILSPRSINKARRTIRDFMKNK